MSYQRQLRACRRLCDKLEQLFSTFDIYRTETSTRRRYTHPTITCVCDSISSAINYHTLLLPTIIHTRARAFPIAEKEEATLSQDERRTTNDQRPTTNDQRPTTNDQRTNEPTNQRTNDPTNQRTNEPTNQRTNEPTNPRTDAAFDAIVPSFRRSIVPSFHRSIVVRSAFDAVAAMNVSKFKPFAGHSFIHSSFVRSFAHSKAPKPKTAKQQNETAKHQTIKPFNHSTIPRRSHTVAAAPVSSSSGMTFRVTVAGVS